MLLSTEGLPGPVIGEQVRKALDRQAEIGARPVGPLGADRPTAPPSDIDAQDRTGHGVEAGAEHEDVERVLRVANADSGLSDLVDGRLLDADEGDVVAVVRLVVVDVDAHPLGRERVLVRTEDLRKHGIVDAGADLPAHEVGDELVRLLVREQVREGA